METKQVIVMRKDLGMRKGKMIAQGAHASMAWLTRKFETAEHDDTGFADLEEYKSITLSGSQRAWLETSFKKICVYVDSETALADICLKAMNAGLTVHTVIDKGDTEFHGIPTVTCCAIGPDESSKINAVTGHLPLL